MPDNIDAPDPFAILAQQPIAMPDIQSGGPAHPTLAPQPVKGRSRLPGIAGMIADLIKPPTQVQAQPGGMAEARPVSRLDTFENFLGNFLYSMGQGMAGGGTGPGANARGFGIAVTAPYERELQQQQLQSKIAAQQSQSAEEQARAGLYQKQGELAGTQVTLPNGMTVPASVATQWMRGTGAAEVTAKSRMSVEQMKAMLAMGQVAKIMPVQDQGGMVMRAFNKYGQPLGDIDGAIPPTSYLGKTSSTVDYKQLEDGSIVALPKTTTSGPNIPGARKPGVAAGGPIRVVNGVVSNADGTPIQFKGGITSTTKTMIETAPKVLDLINRTAQLVDQQKDSLGPLASRWNEYMAGKVGAPNPDFTKLRTNVGLLETLLMRMHVGARGGTDIMKHFKDLMDSGKQSPENLQAALGEIKAYAQEVGSSRGLMGTATAPPTKDKVSNLVNKYK